MDDKSIGTSRAFNRRYTVWLNVMNRPYLGSKYTWQESRLLFEIYRHEGTSAAELSAGLGLDKSYMSRLISKLEKDGMLTRQLIPGTRGVKSICLTARGIAEAELIDRRGDIQMREKLSGLDDAEIEGLCRAMDYILRTLDKNSEKTGRE